jgi:hypothetical protein
MLDLSKKSPETPALWLLEHSENTGIGTFPTEHDPVDPKQDFDAAGSWRRATQPAVMVGGVGRAKRRGRPTAAGLARPAAALALGRSLLGTSRSPRS